MKALLCRGFGSPPATAIEDRPIAAPGPGEVAIDVAFAALNFTDVLMLKGSYQDRPALPFVPGLDAAGVVSEVGHGVTAFRVGQRVISSGVVGAFTSRLIAPPQRLVAIPDALATDQAVGAINSHLTAYHALRDRAAIRPGERLLVLGAAGAVGRATVQIGKCFGAEVIAVVRDADQIATVRQLGADHCIACEPAELRSAIRTLGFVEGIDVVLDPIGGDIAEAAVRAMRWRGRYLVVGFAAGEIPKIPLNLLLLKGSAILGVYCGRLLTDETGSFTEQLAAMLRLLAEGIVAAPKTEIFPAGDFDNAWKRFHDRANDRKIVFRFDGLRS